MTSIPKNIFFVFLTICCLTTTTAFGLAVNYSIQFVGLEDRAVLTKMREVSELQALKDQPPATLTALRRRTESDIKNFVRVLHSYAYYNARIKYAIKQQENGVIVTVLIDPGPAYPFAGYRIIDQNGETTPTPVPGIHLPPRSPFDTIKTKHLSIRLGGPALAETILSTEKQILLSLSKRGYPFSKVINRDVAVEQTEKAVYVTLFLDIGPKVRFGKTVITGLTDVEEPFVRRRIAWKEGEWFDPQKIDRTVESLDDTGLFSSTNINYLQEDNADHVTMTIDLSESLHRSIASGVAYTTQRGPGLSVEWEDRNIEGKGEKLGVKGEYWNHAEKASIYYKKPDFIRKDQDFIWIAEYSGEETRSYDEYSVSLSAILDRQINERLKVSYGATLQQMHSNSSEENENYTLVKIPLGLKWSTANNLLNPTKGRTLNLKVTPAAQCAGFNHYYATNSATGIMYQPLTYDYRLVLATKITVQSILGAKRLDIPAPDRLYAGSENLLRGYRYLSVSPLNNDGDSVGGLSLGALAIEPRMLIIKNFWMVFFYEIGNVYEERLPQLHRKQLQSLGIGWRYDTAIGPVRLDIAKPLDRRKNPADKSSYIDNHFEFYLSIGQAF